MLQSLIHWYPNLSDIPILFKSPPWWWKSISIKALKCQLRNHQPKPKATSRLFHRLAPSILCASACLTLTAGQRIRRETYVYRSDLTIWYYLYWFSCRCFGHTCDMFLPKTETQRSLQCIPQRFSFRHCAANPKEQLFKWNRKESLASSILLESPFLQSIGASSLHLC